MFSIPASSLRDKLFNGYRVVGIFLLYVLWGNSHSDVAGLLLLLTLVIFMLFRARFPRQTWTLLFDQFAAIGVSLLWPGGGYALVLPGFEAVYWGTP